MNLYRYDEAICLLVGVIAGVVIARSLLRDYVTALVAQCDSLTDENERLNDELNANVVPIQQHGRSVR